MAPPPVDMAPPPVDMAPPPVDMAPPPVDMAPPPVDMAPPPVDMALLVDMAPDMDAPPIPRPGDLVITEVMPDPHGALADRFAQWIEIQNVSARALALDGCAVDVDRGSAELAGMLPPDERLLVGNSADPARNGGLEIDAVFDATLSVRGGTLVIRCADDEIDRVEFGRRPQWPVFQAHAFALDPERFDAHSNDLPESWCLAPDVYWQDADPRRDNRGSPGLENPSCTRLAAEARIDAPAELVGAPGEFVQVRGQLRHPGLTDRTARTDRSVLTIAQVGYGPPGTLPDEDWIWLTAGTDLDWLAPPDAADWDGYQRLIQLPDRGRYDLAWRFSVDEGRSWRLADRGAGSSDGYQIDNAIQLRVEGTARVRAAGELVISEIFFAAPGPLQAGIQWIELHNPLDEPLDLAGCTLTSPLFEQAPLDGLVVQAGAYLAIPRVADAAVNGGIETPVGFGFVLPSEGSLAVTCRFEIDRIRWDDGVLYTPVENAALQLTPAALDASANEDPATWCPASVVYDPPSDRRGTPGAANVACPPLEGYPPLQVERLFAVHCGDCHLNGVALGDLSLDPLDLNTFDIPAIQLPAMALITPGDRQQSYLWHKLSGTHFDLPDADGVQMPPGQPFQPGVVERIGLYIDALMR
jgi:hypothetical protein